MPRIVIAITLGLSLASCSRECVNAPCPLGVAVAVDVTSTTSGTGISGAAVEVSGAFAATMPCEASCQIRGAAGTYVLKATAPGYQSMERTVVVQGSTSTCGCGAGFPTTQQVTFVLTPAS
jgi:hypothetical protein